MPPDAVHMAAMHSVGVRVRWTRVGMRDAWHHLLCIYTAGVPAPAVLAALALVCATQGQAIARGLLAGAFSHLTLPHVGSLCICHTVVSDRPRADMLATTSVWRTTSTSPSAACSKQLCFIM